VELIKDRETGSSKGFAFVEMESQQEAEEAIKLFNGYSLDNREIRVSPARPREESGRGDFGNRRGGYSNQRGRGAPSGRSHRGGTRRY
jgi:RNA recognition motif-containing protein